MRKFVVILTFIVLVWTLTACQVPKGSVIFIENISCSGFEIQFSEWDEHNKCELSLNKGDEIQIVIVCEKGSVTLNIHEKNGMETYSGNGLESAQFSVKVPEAGEYVITIRGEDASGSIDIKKALTTK